MWRPTLLAWFVLSQAILLVFAGVLVCACSQTLMTVLIHFVGEEQALGADNVIHLASGGTLLTNPGAMVFWMLPFWAIGLLQFSAAATLIALWYPHRPWREPREVPHESAVMELR